MNEPQLTDPAQLNLINKSEKNRKNYNNNNKLLVHKESESNPNFKWLVLVLSCFTLFGNYYCIDSPGAMKNILKKHFTLSDTDFEYTFSMFYSTYSIPNIILPLLGGVLILKLGNRLTYMICALCIMIGQMVFTIGVAKVNPTLALIGRAIFGLGGETINTTQSTILIHWFPVSQISLVFGVSLSFARLSSVLNDILSPKIATSSDISTSLWVGFTFCAFSFITTLILIYMDWRQNLKTEMKKSTDPETNDNLSDRPNIEEEVDFSLNHIFSMNKVSSNNNSNITNYLLYILI